MAYDEDEQLARLHQWWLENWKALISGLAIGIAGIFGWNAWQSAAEERAEAASSLFSQFTTAVESDALSEAEGVRQALVENHGGSPYAVAASMRLAAARAGEGEYAAAAELLRWSRDNAEDDAMAELAGVRLARAEWAQGHAEEALSLLDAVDTTHYVAVAEELRGDILLSEGNRAEAHAAYERAFAASPQENRELLQQKLDDLADVAKAEDA